MDRKLLKTRLPAANKVLSKAGQNGFDWIFVQGSTFFLRLNFSAKNPSLRQYPNRCASFFLNNETCNYHFTYLLYTC